MISESHFEALELLADFAVEADSKDLTRKAFNILLDALHRMNETIKVEDPIGPPVEIESLDNQVTCDHEMNNNGGYVKNLIKIKPEILEARGKKTERKATNVISQEIIDFIYEECKKGVSEKVIRELVFKKFGERAVSKSTIMNYITRWKSQTSNVDQAVNQLIEDRAKQGVHPEAILDICKQVHGEDCVTLIGVKDYIKVLKLQKKI